ncbi:hypothetical protein O181_093707 [Austropuccinia psidii MF-1]|uniref:Uncharacterized protein n=1 Tax=Austropuccinia psidii MF-1 TaxID=1389203 RepID=A0A9Q3J1J1_9BASI|nr:hypothetical protein [Austropuccinia psidii MF-1]
MQARRLTTMPFIAVGKLHELSTDCEKASGPSKHLQATQLIAFIYGKDKNYAFNSRMEEKQPSTTQTNAKNIPNIQKQQVQHEKAAPN